MNPGTNVDGKYRVERQLGEGGMATVFAATHVALGEKVAIKVLQAGLADNPTVVERFMREARAAVKLKSEYVARVSDVGALENGTPYMVMEYLEGHDLGELLKQRTVLPVQWAVELMLQTAEALCEAHSLGIVHRDVKPTNLFVTWRPDGTSLIKVLDFGISKSPMGTDMQLTQTQSLLGTPAYMSPEQATGGAVDARADVYALGIVLYEMATGVRPFQSPSGPELVRQHLLVELPSMLGKRADLVIHPALDALARKAAAKSRVDRFADGGEMAAALDALPADAIRAAGEAVRVTSSPR